MDDSKNPDELDVNLGTSPAEAGGEQPAASSAKDDAEQANGSGRYAVYDRDELRFYGPVHETRKSADDLKSKLGKDKRRGRYEVREV